MDFSRCAVGWAGLWLQLGCFHARVLLCLLERSRAGFALAASPSPVLCPQHHLLSASLRLAGAVHPGNFLPQGQNTFTPSPIVPMIFRRHI